MKRKLLAVLLALVLCLSMFSSAMACSYNSSNYRKAVNIVNNANSKIRALVLTAQLTPYNDVAWLISSTNSVAANARYQVRCLGFDVECTYTYYWVDGMRIAIDPLYVVNPRPEQEEK